MWVVDQDRLNPYVAYEGYVIRVLHNALSKCGGHGVAAYSAATTRARIGAASAHEIP
jgi:hypothetical protein